LIVMVSVVCLLKTSIPALGPIKWVPALFTRSKAARHSHPGEE
jgi:hypothetical protein